MKITVNQYFNINLIDWINSKLPHQIDIVCVRPPPPPFRRIDINVISFANLAKKTPHLKWNWPNSLKYVFYCHQNRLATMLNFLVFTYIVHCRHQKRTCCIRGVLESYEFLLVCHFMFSPKCQQANFLFQRIVNS